MARKAKKKDPQQLIVDLLLERSGMKQDVAAKAKATFSIFREEVKAVADRLGPAIASHDSRLEVTFKEQGELAVQLNIAGDSIIFTLHTNVFRLDQSNSLWKTSYLEHDEQRGYFGVINIYNFLSDSFKFNRERDLGYLVARVLLNKEGHFFVQGKRQLGFLYNNLESEALDRDKCNEVITSVILYVLDFDLLAPPYDQVNQVTVEEMNQINSNSLISTGKRLGFRFQADLEDIS